jgi:hypothetical protein
MKKSIYCLLLLGLGITIACKKESAEPVEFEKGKVLIGIKDGVAIDRAFRLADSLNLSINQMNGFYYRSGLPNDSVAYINRLLLAKPYLNKGGFTGSNARVNVVTKQLEVLNLFFDMTVARQQDWLTTMPQLQLTPLPTTTAYMSLQVPDGQEQAWLLKLSRSNMVKWAELNYYSKIALF